MKRRWLAFVVVVVVLAIAALVLWRGERADAGAAGPDEREPVPSVAAIRALAAVPEAAPRSSALPVDEPAAMPATSDSVRCLVLGGDGQPRDGVPVFLLRTRDDVEQDAEKLDPEKSEFLGERKTADGGRVEFPIDSRGLLFVCSIVEKERVHVAAWVGNAREVVLRYPPVYTGDFEIEVVTEAGAPVPEYVLRAWSDRGESMTSVLDTTVRSADGRFRCAIANKVSSRETLVLQVIGPVEFAPVASRYTYDQVLEEGVRRIVLVEKKGGVRGTVVTSAGVPVEGARVTWTESRDDSWGVGATTSARGEFVLDAKALRDRGVLCVQSDGHAPFLSAMPEVATSVAGELRVELEAGAALEGLVTLDGEPLPDAFLIAWIASSRPHGFGPAGFWSSSAETGSDGRYRIERLPRGQLFVAVQPMSVRHGVRRYYGGVQRVEITAALQQHDVRISPEVHVRGSLDVDVSKRARFFLEVYDARDPSIPWSTSQCTNGEEFELAVPRASDATLRIWLNPSAMHEVPIPATSEPLDLGEIEIEMARLRPPGSK